MFRLDTQKLLKMSNEEIFGEEKKYRPLFISFFVALFILTSAFLAAAILANVSWNDPKTIDQMKTDFDNQQQIKDWEQYKSILLTSKVILPYIMFGFSLAVTVVFSISLFNAYKNKDFSLISFVPMFTVGFIAFYSVFNFVGLIIKFQQPGEPSGIISTVASVLTIFIWFFISRHVSLLKKCCTIAKINQQRAEMFGASFGNPNMNMNNSNADAFQARTNNSDSQVEELRTEDIEADIIDDKYRRKLQALSLKEIRKIGEKLSISGCEEMSKKKLIELILQITSANQSNKEKETANKYDNPETIEEIEIDEGA